METVNYGRNKFYDTGPRSSLCSKVEIRLKHFLNFTLFSFIVFSPLLVKVPNKLEHLSHPTKAKPT